MGVGDQVPQALSQLGARVDLITPEQLASGDLSQYNVDRHRRARLRAPPGPARQQPAAARLRRRPAARCSCSTTSSSSTRRSTGRIRRRCRQDASPTRTRRSRCCSRIDPVFTTPEQARARRRGRAGCRSAGSTSSGERDSALRRSACNRRDPFQFNQGVKTGALVEARVGKGRWVYIGLGLWRQLPAGTDGAYRLMANLISLR